MSIPLIPAADGTVEVPCLQPVDLEVAPVGTPLPGNPFDARFGATFRGPGGRVVTVPGHYDELRGCAVRFAPTAEGVWHLATRSEVPALDGIAGTLYGLPRVHDRLHGLLRIDPEYPRHFRFEDGTRHYLMGYEANWLLLIDQDDERLDRVGHFLDGIAAAGFNMVTVNAYAHHCPGWLTPEQERDPRYVTPVHAPWVGGNERPDYGRFDPAFFQHVDRVMEATLERGLIVHLMVHVYNKGVRWPELGSADDERFWRYVVARYQAFCNVVWDPAKESYYRHPEYIWERIATLRHHDGYGHLVTVHDANRPPGSRSRTVEAAHDPRKDLSDDLADFASDQVHRDHYRDARTRHAARPRPYVNIEYGYEEGVEDLPTYGVKQGWREVLRRTWLVTMGGAYPNYYYSNTAWNLFVPEPEPPGYAAHRRYLDFWLGTAYWRLVPDDRPLGDDRPEGAHCRADPGHEYVVMAEGGAGFALSVEGAAGELRATWLNPYTGERFPAGSVGDGRHRFEPPWPEEAFCVLHLS